MQCAVLEPICCASGDVLLAEFKKRQAQVRPAAEALLAEAEAAAVKTLDDVFFRRRK